MEFQVSREDQKAIGKILRAGIQQVRVVLRAIALEQLTVGQTAPAVARNVHQPFGGSPIATGTMAWKVPYMNAKDEEPKSCWKTSDKQRIIAMVCSQPPEGQARWTVRLIAEEGVKRKLVPQVGRETIRILLSSHDLSRGGKKMWCVADLDAEYLRKMEDVLAVFEKPYHAATPVVCPDEKPVSLHADVRPPVRARPGQIAKRDNEYKRCGTANVFCAVEPKAGRHFTFPTPDRSAPELARVLNRIGSSEY